MEEKIKEMKRIEAAIRKHANYANRVSAFGAGASIISGFGAVVCYRVVPFTNGDFLIPAVGLTGLSIAGAGVSVGSSMVNYLVGKAYMRDAQEAHDKCNGCGDEVDEVDGIGEDFFKDAAGEEIKLSVLKVAAPALGKAARFVGQVSFFILLQLDKSFFLNEAICQAKVASVLLKHEKMARFAGRVVVFILLPLEIVFFVKNVINLEKSAAADAVHKLAKELE